MMIKDNRTMSSHEAARATRRVIIVTGLSGSGKSTVLKTLEDLGFFCVDNLPPRYLPHFLQTVKAWLPDDDSLGITVDVREKVFLRDFPEVFRMVKKIPDTRVEVLFLEASLDTLLRRFQETRRPHPLARNRTIHEGVVTERRLLSPLRRYADRTIDTSALSVHQLRRYITQIYSSPGQRAFNLFFLSFGYRYGLPTNADIVFDVRFLPNPYFESTLRPLSGRDKAVQRFLLAVPETRIFIKKVDAFLHFLLPKYRHEGKHYVTIAIGCTGGHHRSVALAEILGRHWQKLHHHVTIDHRDLAKPEL